MSMFGNLGEMAGLMKKFGEIQKNMKKMKGDLAAIEVAGENAAGQVEVVVSGDFNVKKVYISPSLAEMKDAAILESAVFEAMNNALVQAKMESAKKLSEATGGINIPGITG